MTKDSTRQVSTQQPTSYTPSQILPIPQQPHSIPQQSIPPLSTPQQPPQQSQQPFSLGATVTASTISGMAKRVFVHPLDTIKARMQVEKVKSSLIQTARTTWTHHGIRGLYAGFTTSFFGAGPATALYLTSYELFKRQLAGPSHAAPSSSSSSSSSTTSLLHYHPLAGYNHHFLHLTAGLLAEAFSCVLWVPIDVVKERMQVQTLAGSPFKYNNPIHAIRTINRVEGVRGLYKGYWATLYSFGPFSALYLAIYEEGKAVWQRLLSSSSSSSLHREGSGGTLPAYAFLTSGAVAGGLASWFTTPLDLVKLRLQVQRSQIAAQKLAAEEGASIAATAAAAVGGGGGGGGGGSFLFRYTNFSQGLLELVRSEGVRGLWRGATARVCYHAPSQAIGIAIYDSLKHHLQFN